MKAFGFIAFVAKLVFYNIWFAVSVSLCRLSRFRAIFFLYVVLFLQALLVVGSVYNQQQKLLFFQKQQQADGKIGQQIDLTQLPSHRIVAKKLSTSEAQSLLRKHQQALENNPNNHALLVNSAILQLKINGGEKKFQNLVKEARQINPNWDGWTQVKN